MAQQQFDTLEAEAVLMEAARRQARSVGGTSLVSRERLNQMAAELDIAPETLAMVLAEREFGANEAALRSAYITERRGSVVPHLVPYISVCTMLFFIWLITTPGGHPWFLYPIMGWGIGVASHIAAVFPTTGTAFESGFEEYKKKVERREKDKARRLAKRMGKEEVKQQDEDILPEPTEIVWKSAKQPVPETVILKGGRKS